VRRTEEPIRLAAIVERCLDGVAGERGASAIWRVWEDAVGPAVARRAQPVRLRGRTLVVAVSSAPWMQELQLLKADLRTALNARLAEPLVEDFFFIASDAADFAAATEAARSPRAPVVSRSCGEPPLAIDLRDLPEPLRRGFAGVLAAWRRRAASESTE
jgi:hypothetical protein